MGTWDDSSLLEASSMAYSTSGSNRAFVNGDENRAVHLVDLETGETLAKVSVKDRTLVDPESSDIDAAGAYNLFDIGDNDENRSSVVLYTRGQWGPGFFGAKPFVRYVLKYPSGTSHNAEAGLCHPDGNRYIISKTASGAIYKLPKNLKTGATNTMTVEHGSDSDLAFVSEAKFSRDGLWMFVIKKDQNSTIYVWRVSDWTQVATISMTAMTKPEGLCLTKDGKGLWVCDDDGSPGGFYQRVSVPAAYQPAGSGGGAPPPPVPPVNPCAA